MGPGVVLWMLLSATMLSPTSAESSAGLVSYLQQEAAAVTQAQHAVQQFLLSKQVPVGLSPLASQALRRSRQTAAQQEPHRIALSSEDNDITCRISLTRVPLGRKCKPCLSSAPHHRSGVAPCGCSGSQEWVQFSELNRLRRLEPSQWTVCQTCRRRFDYGAVQMYGGVLGNLVSLALDHVSAVRAGAMVLLAVLGSLCRVGSLALRVATSTALWQLVR